MHRNHLVAAASAICLVLVNCTVAADPRDGAMLNTVHAQGRARIEVPPDRASFTAGVETNAPEVSKAVQENNDRVRALIDAIVRAGVDRKNIRSAYVSINPEYDHAPGRQPRIVGYRVHNSVNVGVEAIAEVGKLMQVAIDAGANQVDSLSWSVSDAETARARTAGLEAAFDDAKGKARVLATRAGRTLGAALILVEGGDPVRPPQPMYDVRAMEMNASAVPIEPGQSELVFTISAVFGLD
jgi:uncharacterized protein YggE